MKQQLPSLGLKFATLPSLLLCIVFAVTILAPAVVQFSGLATTTKYLDNRLPVSLPKLPQSISEVEAFRKGLTTYLNDNFGLRAELVSANMLIHLWIGVSATPSNIAGRGGRWLFLTVDESIEQFRGISRFSEVELDLYVDALERYHAWLKRRGILFMFVIAPDKHTIYPEFLPSYVNKVWPETRHDQLVRRLRERNSDVNLIDLRPILFAARDRYDLLYRRYESHWNALGGFLSYRAVAQQIANSFPSVRPLKLSDFNISYSKMRWIVPPKSEILPVLTRKSISPIVATEIIDADKRVIERRSNVAKAPSILIYGDSFTEVDFVQFMAETFSSTIHAFTARGPFPQDLIERRRPAIVIFETVERSLSHTLENRDLETDVLVDKAPSYDQLAHGSKGVSGGVVDMIQEEAERIRLIGWAADTTAKVPLKAVFAFLGNRVIGAGVPMDVRPDVLPTSPNQRAGFRIAIPRTEINRFDKTKLRLFGVATDNTVYELAFNPAVILRLEQLGHQDIQN